MLGQDCSVIDIYLNRQPVIVTANLEFLRIYFSIHLDKNALLWIDALSINPSDPQERRQQVALMQRIHAEAFQM